MNNKWMTLTPEQERELGVRILEAESRALAEIEGLACVQSLLTKKRKGSERTRAGEVDRLGEAIQRVADEAREDPSLKGPSRRARAAWAEAEEARWTLAMSGRRVAYREARKLKSTNLDFADLLQEGHIGLLRAAKRYDPARDIRFSTYARWWVRAQMTRSIDRHGRTVRLPGGAIEALRNMKKAMKELDDQGVEWTIADLASYARIDVERAEFLLSRKATLSLEESVDDGADARSIADVLPDEQADDPAERTVLNDELSRMHRALHDTLDQRQFYVLQRRYGLADGSPCSLSEVARSMSLSRERVRQIERKALDALRERGGIRELAAG